MSSLSYQSVISPVEIEIQPVAVTVIVPEEKKKKVRVLKADKAEKKADKAEKKADKAEKTEKKVKVSKKKNTQEKAVNEVVQMVQEMKTAFIDTVQEEVTKSPQKPPKLVEEEPELMVDMYIEEQETTLVDFDVDFDTLRLDGDETPMCVVPEEEANAVKEDKVEAVEDKVEAVEDKVEAVKEDKVEAAPIATAPPATEAEATVVRTVFRHEFSAECFSLLKEFAHTNAQLPRKAYKQAWEQFTDANAEFISQESARLADSGYTGDVVAKMFKTAKYYLTKREKKMTESNKVEAVALTDADDDKDDDATVSTPSSPLHTQQQAQAPSRRRRSYIALDRKVLRAMDVHITTATSGSGSKPSICYTAFCEQFHELIEVEVARLARLETSTFSEKDAQDKLKKTYKNRMFCSAHSVNTDAGAGSIMVA